MADEVNNNTEDVEAVVVESAPVAYHYDASLNPNNGFFPGVSRGSITQEQYDRLPAHLQRSIAASPMYIATGTEEGEGATPTKPKPKSKAKE